MKRIIFCVLALSAATNAFADYDNDIKKLKTLMDISAYESTYYEEYGEYTYTDLERRETPDNIDALEKAILEKNEEAVKLILSLLPEDHDYLDEKPKGFIEKGHLLTLVKDSGSEKIKNYVYEKAALQTADSAHYKYRIFEQLFGKHDDFLRFAIGKKLRPFAYDSVNDNLIRYTLLKGNIPLLKFLLENGLNPKKAQCLNGLASDKGFYKETPYQTKKEIIQLLVKNGDDPNVVDYKKKPYLEDLIRYCSDLDFVVLLIENGASIKKIPGALLHLFNNSNFAADEKGLKIVQLFLDKGADVNATEWDGEKSVLYQACWEDKKDGKLVKMILENGASTKITKKQIESNHIPVSEALWCGNFKALELLKKYGASLKGVEILTDASSSPTDSEECMKLVLKENSDLEAKTHHDRTAFWYAAWRGNPKIMRYLHSIGAKTNTVDSETKQTGFMAYLEYMAKEPFRFKIEPVLAALDCDIDLNYKDASGKNVKDYAVLLASAATDPEQKILTNQMMDAINKKIAQSGAKAETTIYDAVTTNDNKTLAKLLASSSMKAKINEKDTNGFSAMDYAVMSNNVEAAQILLENGASYTKKQILTSIEKGQADMLRTFFSHGINVNLSLFNKDFTGNSKYYEHTPLIQAFSQNEMNEQVLLAILEFKPDLSSLYSEHTFLYSFADKYTHKMDRKTKCKILKKAMDMGADPFQNNGEFFRALADNFHDDEIFDMLKYIAKDKGMFKKFFDENGRFLNMNYRDNEKYEKAVLETQLMGKIMKVKENLNIRENPYQSASGTNLVCTLQAGSEVKILKLSHKQSIDNLNSFWVYVEITDNAVTRDGKKIQKGTKGYCFSGYLE